MAILCIMLGKYVSFFCRQLSMLFHRICIMLAYSKYARWQKFLKKERSFDGHSAFLSYKNNHQIIK